MAVQFFYEPSDADSARASVAMVTPSLFLFSALTCNFVVTETETFFNLLWSLSPKHPCYTEYNKHLCVGYTLDNLLIS